MKENVSKSMEYHLKEDEILYFLHMGKTAGITLVTIIDNMFDLDSIFPVQSWDNLPENLPENFLVYKLIRGHFGYGIDRILPEIEPKRIVYITMLRDPIERTLSFYDYLYLNKNENIIEENYFSINNKNYLENIKEFVKMNRFKDHQLYLMTFDLSVPFVPQNPIEPTVLERFLVNRTSSFTISNFSDDKLLEIAKQRLSEFTFFGLTERFNESLSLLCYTFGWRPIRYVLKENVTPNRIKVDDLSRDTIDTIRECTKYDKELYSYAQQLFDARFSQMVKQLREKYSHADSNNHSEEEVIYELLEKNYDDRYYETRSHVNSVDYNFKQKLDGSGWYARQFTPDGIAIRWTGPETISTIDFPLIRDIDYRIQFYVVMCLAIDILESLRLKINETPIDLSVLQQNGGKIVFEGIIPKSSLDSEKNFTRLAFQVNRTISPKSVNPDSFDTRMLGLAFEWIKITPNNGSNDIITLKQK